MPGVDLVMVATFQIERTIALWPEYDIQRKLLPFRRKYLLSSMLILERRSGCEIVVTKWCDTYTPYLNLNIRYATMLQNISKSISWNINRNVNRHNQPYNSIISPHPLYVYAYCLFFRSIANRYTTLFKAMISQSNVQGERNTEFECS